MRKFLRCEVCGNMTEVINDSGVPMICCGKPMIELEANTSDGAGEKHVPVVKVDGEVLTVRVGEVDHPMLDEHYIQWIHVETETGGLRKNLKPGEEPAATFNLAGEKAIAVYEYCNLHGLWKKEL